jgi:hypothetical protein
LDGVAVGGAVAWPYAQKRLRKRGPQDHNEYRTRAEGSAGSKPGVKRDLFCKSQSGIVLLQAAQCMTPQIEIRARIFSV